MMKRSLHIIPYIVVPTLACLCLFVLEQIMLVDYYTKTISKIILFVSIPIIVKFIIRPSGTKTKAIGFNDIKLGLGIGLGIIAIISLAYSIFKGYIDSKAIVSELSGKSKITALNYPFIGLYITLGNSFLEEFFFRNFIFLNLYGTGQKKLSYIASSLLFSIYHVAIFKTWFSPVIILLSLFGLAVAGLVLDYVNTKNNSMFNSWIIHICADLPIIIIGYTWIMR